MDPEQQPNGQPEANEVEMKQGGYRLRNHVEEWLQLGQYNGLTDDDLMRLHGQLPPVGPVKMIRMVYKVSLQIDGEWVWWPLQSAINVYQGWITRKLQELADMGTAGGMSCSFWNGLVRYCDQMCTRNVCVAFFF